MVFRATFILIILFEYNFALKHNGFYTRYHCSLFLLSIHMNPEKLINLVYIIVLFFVIQIVIDKVNLYLKTAFHSKQFFKSRFKEVTLYLFNYRHYFERNKH